MEEKVKQLLLEEIQRLYVEQREDQKTIQNILLLSSRYPFLSHLCNKFAVTASDWEGLVRDALFYTKNDVRYMYDRTMQIVRRFKEVMGEYFQVKNPFGTYLIPDRLSDFNRLFSLYGDFFDNIYPGIINELNITTLALERNTSHLRGKIDWNKTILNNMSTCKPNIPLNFVTLISESSLDTPENLLLLSYCIRVHLDSKALLVYNFKDPLNSEEIIILDKICSGSKSIIKNTLLQHLNQKALDYANLSIYDRQLLSLEDLVLVRLRNGLIRQKKYSLLLDWIDKYRELNIRTVSPNHTNFPLDKTKSLDMMFELWVVFEILDYLVESKGATVNKLRGNRFGVNIDGIAFELRYQPGYHGWALKGEPDYSIEVNGKCKVILDAKNWAERKDDAIYKMLGYLNNLDGSLGVLLFPNDVSLSNGYILKAVDLENNSNQIIFNCVLPLSGDNKIERKNNVLKELMELILNHITNSS